MSGRSSAFHKASACTVRAAKGRHSEHHQVPATEYTCSCTPFAPGRGTKPDPEAVRLHVTHYTLVTVICKHTVLGSWCYLHITIGRKYRTHARTHARSIWQTPRTSYSTNRLTVCLFSRTPSPPPCSPVRQVAAVQGDTVSSKLRDTTPSVRWSLTFIHVIQNIQSLLTENTLRPQ
jgi:hypothetical protein